MYRSLVNTDIFPIRLCEVCGSKNLAYFPILWKKLIQDWELSPHEIKYINYQQGLYCNDCKVNLRTMALAKAMMRTHNYHGYFASFVTTRKIRKSRILEINSCGNLTPFLNKIGGHQLSTYPETDLMNMRYSDNTYDFVIHSDTLEHILDPIKALSECYRILKPDGFCVFTVPIIVDRLTRTRHNLSDSYHGDELHQTSDLLVYSEYGADVWKQVIMAGFTECRIYSLVYPYAQALIGVK